MVKDGTCGAFDLLNAMFSSFLVLFVGFRLLSTCPISTNNLASTPHKLFLCIIRQDVDWDTTLEEAVLKDLGNGKA